ncbi:MAG: sensor histidine kinase, partial [Gorillibacterium sp.]|nr:sensor histidine kinase [Gorillibacterium sp.]
PKFSLQPLVENAIEHGIERLKTAGSLRITGVIEGNIAILTVIDNGIGLTQEELVALRRWLVSEQPVDGSDSIGLINVRQRIASTFGEQYGIEIDSNYREETRVSLRIPYTHGGETDV